MNPWGILFSLTSMTDGLVICIALNLGIGALSLFFLVMT